MLSLLKKKKTCKEIMRRDLSVFHCTYNQIEKSVYFYLSKINKEKTTKDVIQQSNRYVGTDLTKARYRELCKTYR